MGIFDRLKKPKSETKNLGSVEVSSGLRNERIDEEMRSFKSRIENLDRTPVAQEFRTIVHEEASKLNKEFKTNEFNAQHQKIVELRKEIQHIRFLESLGLQYTKPKSEYMKRYEMLCSSQVMPERNIDKIFLPYLIEKKATGIITKDEQAELDVILGHTKKLEDILNATTTETYTLDYDRALMMLGVIGTLDFDENGEILGYDEGKKIRDITSEMDLIMLTHIQSMAKKLGITVEGIPDSVKQLADEIDTLDETAEETVSPLTSEEVGRGTIEAQNSYEGKYSASNYMNKQIKEIDKTNQTNEKE